MSPWLNLWLCIGIVYLFAISDRSHAGEARFLAVLTIELLWAFVLVAPAATGVIYSLREVFR